MDPSPRDEAERTAIEAGARALRETWTEWYQVTGHAEGWKFEDMARAVLSAVDLVPRSELDSYREALESAESFIETVTQWTGTHEDEKQEALDAIREALASQRGDER